jgi:hypothetical protein
MLQEHEKVISIEDMTSSVELDYTDNPTLIVPSYTHQVIVQGKGRAVRVTGSAQASCATAVYACPLQH